MNTVLQVGSLAEVLAYIATSLGFQPADSLVAVSVRPPRSRIGLVTRVDLDAATDTAHDLVMHLVRDGAGEIIVVTYSDDTDAAAEAAEAVRQAAEPMKVGHAVVTSGGYAWFDEPGLRPMSDLDSTGVAAMSVYSGIAVRTSREDLAPRVQDTDAIAAARAAAALDYPGALTSGDVLAAWRRAVSEHTHDPQTLGRLARTLTDVTVRDAVLVLMVTNSDEQATAVLNHDDGAARAALDTLMQGAQHPGDSVNPWAETLALVAAHQDPEPVAAPAWTLWAITQWWAGAGAAANVGVEKALAADDTHRLAHLMADCLSAGIGPGWTRHQ